MGKTMALTSVDGAVASQRRTASCSEMICTWGHYQHHHNEHLLGVNCKNDWNRMWAIKFPSIVNKRIFIPLWVWARCFKIIITMKMISHTKKLLHLRSVPHFFSSKLHERLRNPHHSSQQTATRKGKNEIPKLTKHIRQRRMIFPGNAVSQTENYPNLLGQWSVYFHQWSGESWLIRRCCPSWLGDVCTRRSQQSKWRCCPRFLMGIKECVAVAGERATTWLHCSWKLLQCDWQKFGGRLKRLPIVDGRGTGSHRPHSEVNRCVRYCSAKNGVAFFVWHITHACGLNI